MVSHHRLSIGIACPSCGAPGKIRVVERAGPPFTDPPSRTYSPESPGFVFLPDVAPPEIECQTCSAVFPGPL
jgi:hypothetical protein